MSVIATLSMTFPSKVAGKIFCRWLEQDGFEAELDGSWLEVTVFAHGDRVVVMEEARERGAKFIKDEVVDDY
jgi:hypothetical protein